MDNHRPRVLSSRQRPIYPPIDLVVSHFHQRLVGLAETPAPGEGCLCFRRSQGARVRRAQNNVARTRAHQGSLGLFRRRLAPQQKYHPLLCSVSARCYALGLFAPVDGPDDLVRQIFPTLFLVAVCLALSHRQDVVDHQHPLPGPTLEVTVGRDRVKGRDVRVVLQLLVDVPERRGGLDAPADGKAEAVGLPGPVVRVLPHDHQLDIGKGTKVQRGKDVFGGRKYCLFSAFGVHERRKPSKGGSREVLVEGGFPGHNSTG
mmetsp:Transcript_19034/g.39104  ORF Transcript_19034/g.39104 Transcript_19034/m.39104 type:complete len:260 (+) Transcript_19034:41-820(+)